MRLIPSEGSDRYSPGPGMVALLEERSYQEIRLSVAICSQTPPGILAIDSSFVPLCTPNFTHRKVRTLGSLITATLLGIGDYVGPHVVFRRTKLSVFPSIIPPQLLGFYKVANTVLLSISEPRVRRALRFLGADDDHSLSTRWGGLLPH